MKRNYSELISATRNRLNPDGRLIKAFSNESLSSYSDVYRFVEVSMSAVDSGFTNRSIEAGERVKGHLQTELKNVSYRYQGSVMTDTHIKGYSDIDLLVINEDFFSWDRSNATRVLESMELRRNYSSNQIAKLTRANSGGGYTNALNDLRRNRIDSERILAQVYEDCNTGKPKSIKIYNKSLKREVDIVISNWYDSVSAIINDGGIYRGIQVYNKDLNQKGDASYPFLSIERINNVGKLTNGKIKKMIRFLKNCRVNCEGVLNKQIDITSFDINSICYAIPVDTYKELADYELVAIIYLQLKKISENEVYANSLMSVDGSEPIFFRKPKKRSELQIILNEVEAIYTDILKDGLLAS